MCRPDIDSDQSPLSVTSDGIEFGVFTIVAQGTSAIFNSPSTAPQQGVTLEDVISIHILEVSPVPLVNAGMCSL